MKSKVNLEEYHNILNYYNMQNNQQSSSLPKYRYPIPIFIFLLFILFSIIITIHSVYVFIKEDIEHNIKLSYQLHFAKLKNKHQEFKGSAKIYKNILRKYPHATNIQSRLAANYFLRYQENKKYYIKGLSYLKEIKYEPKDVKYLEKYVPQEYKKEFDDMFRKLWHATIKIK